VFVKPVLEERRCLRSGPGRSGCTVCRDVCPNPGFHLNGGTVTFPGDCFACHFCTAVCPEGAIQGSLPSLRVLEQSTIMLRCDRVYKYGTTPIACVGAIPEAFLEVAAIRKSFVNLITGPCERCEFHVGLSLYEQRINRICRKRILKWRRIELPFNEVPERRRMLEWLWRSVKPDWIRASDYRKLLPAEHSHDTDRMRPTLTDRCVGCPVCEVVCPYFVFQRNETDTGVLYMVDEKRCTGCQKCVDSCPLHAVKLEMASKRSVRTVDLVKQSCPECKEVFFGHVKACPRCHMKDARQCQNDLTEAKSKI
jgi:NAD-dependent dihydropyrimidine dehydrogenase PreA subunit